MELTKCPKCGKLFDRGKANLKCPGCGWYYLPKKFRGYGEHRVIYSKPGCYVFSLGEEYVVKALYGEKKNAGLKEREVLWNLHSTDCGNIVAPSDTELEQSAVFFLEPKYTPLSDYIRSKPVYWEDIRRIAADICNALIFCKDHGFYHLDVHPNNIYIDRGTGRALLGDFGNAQRVSSAGANLLKEVTPRYIYPGYHISKDGPITEQWDLFGLCMVLYGLLSEGALPHIELDPKSAALEILKGKIEPPGQDPLSQLVVRGLSGKCPTQERFLEALDEMDPGPESDHGISYSGRHGFLSSMLHSSRDRTDFQTRHEYHYPDKTQPGNRVMFDSDDDGPVFNGSPAYRPGNNPPAPAAFDACPGAGAPRPQMNGFDSYPPIPHSNISMPVSFDDDTEGSTLPLPGAGAPGPQMGGFDDFPPFLQPNIPMPIFDDGPEDYTLPIPHGGALRPQSDGFDSYPPVPHSNISMPMSFDADPYARTGAFGTDGPDMDFGASMPPMPMSFDADPYARTGALGIDGPDMDFGAFMPPMPMSFDPAPYAGTSMAGEPEKPALSEVYFSAVCEKNAQKDTSLMIDVVMYEKAFREEVDRLLSSLENGQEKRSGLLKAALGTVVTVELTSQDIEIDDGICEMTWEGEYLDFSFFAEVPEDYAKRQIRFTASVFFDGVPATRLKFMVDCRGEGRENLPFMREDIRSAYISYASQDRARVVGLIQGMQSVRPDLDLFFDVENLRTGESWEKALYREIEKKSHLFLCWSSNAQNSSWVDKEWRYALQTKGEGSIIPIPLEPPERCPPPRELEDKHFNNHLLYLIQSRI